MKTTPRQAVTEHWPPYLTERHDPEYNYDVPINTSRHNVRGPVGTEKDAHAAGWVGPYFHGTSSRRAADIRRGGFRQPRVHNQDMRLPGDSEEVDFGNTHRTYFADTHDGAMSFARAHHGDDATVVSAYLHPDHIETGSGGGFMASTQVRDVAKAMAIRPGTKHAVFTQTQARKEPNQRIFGPTYGLDVRLFDGEHLKPAVRTWLLETIGAFWRPLYGTSWRRWARVYFAGSEASGWTSETRVGNGDFDTLVGIKPDLARKYVPGFDGLDDNTIVARLNADLTTLLWPRLLGIEIPTGDGAKAGPFDVTVFVNLKAWSIADIKPYAAYNVTANTWAVRPPVLTDWNIESFPQGHALVQECHAVASYVRAVLAMPEPYRSQQGDALWRHLHSDRGRSFTDQGEGWFDSGNVLEKFLDQLGLWEPLAKLHFDAVADPSKLRTPEGWSNDPRMVR